MVSGVTASPASSAAAERRRSHVTRTTSAGANTRALARCTASAPPRRRRRASSEASTAIAAVSSTTSIAAQRRDHARRDVPSDVRSSRAPRHAAARAVLTSGSASRLAATVSASFQSRSASSLPASSTSSLTKAPLSKHAIITVPAMPGDEISDWSVGLHSLCLGCNGPLRRPRTGQRALPFEALEHTFGVDGHQPCHRNPPLGHDDPLTGPRPIDVRLEMCSKLADCDIHGIRSHNRASPPVQPADVAVCSVIASSSGEHKPTGRTRS